MSDTTQKMAQATSHSVLEDFLGKTLLLTGVYVLINSVFHQVYLRYFGLQIGLLDFDEFFHSKSDFFIIAYSVFLWAVLIRIPDRWYHHLAELLSANSWRRILDISIRLSSIGLFWGTFQFVYYLQALLTHATPPPSSITRLVPTLDFLSDFTTFIILSVVGIIVFFIYKQYLANKEAGFGQLRGNRINFTTIVYQVGVPFLVIYSIIFLGFAVPTTYGQFAARLTVFDMWNTKASRVKSLQVSASQGLCPTLDTSPDPSDPTMQLYSDVNTSTSSDVHYLGDFGGFSMLVIFKPLQNQDRPTITGKQAFTSCLLPLSQIHALSLYGAGDVQ